MRTTPHDSVAFTVVVTMLVCVGALPVLLVIALSGGPDSLVLATALAAIPVGPVVACYMWLDRYEPEPKRLLAAGLLWGGFVATAAALLLQGIGGFVVGFSHRESISIVAPVTEEASKGLFLILLLWWRRAELDGVLDGIVYAGMVGVGFAFIENILYLAAAYNGTDGVGPGGTSAPSPAPSCCAACSARSRTRSSPPSPASASGSRSPRAAGSVRLLAPARRLRARRRRARPLEHLVGLRLRQLRRCLPAADGPRLPAAPRPGRLGAPLRAADADRRPRRRRRPGADPRHRHRLGRRPRAPAAAAAASRASTAAERPSARCGTTSRPHRARLPAPPLPAGHAPARLRRAGTGVRRPHQRRPPLLAFPGQVVPTR